MLKSSENFCLFRVRNVGQFSKILALNNERKLYYQPTFENLGQDTPDTVCTILGKIASASIFAFAPKNLSILLIAVFLMKNTGVSMILKTSRVKVLAQQALK